MTEAQGADSGAALRDLTDALARIERERQRVRPGDWETLFRQMRAVLEQLVDHPFLRGDLHAEMLLGRLAVASDLADLDRRVDDLGEYVAGKLVFTEALIAAREGRAVEPAALVPRRFGAAQSGAGRVLAQHGPSGSDFALSDEAALTPARRGILRL